ncbi:MAG: AlpA family phage regulatory protein [Porticoccaceae bacterium]|jgi:predicted DNA-binding transcriptional regulator AlpA|nr:AlpA family phage regulatory protein [Porticoccaceae bacterium]
MNQETIPLSALKQAVADELARRQQPRYSRPNATAQYLGVSLATCWRWAKERPGFPQPKKLGPRTTAWDLNDIDAFLAAEQEKGG